MKNNKEYQEWLEEVKDNGMAFLEVPNKDYLIKKYWIFYLTK